MTALQAERHCALYFESLGAEEEALFFHADQVIRGMYSIFVEVGVSSPRRWVLRSRGGVWASAVCGGPTS